MSISPLFRWPNSVNHFNQTEVARMLSCARGTVLKYNRDSKGERHVIVNGVLMVKQGKRGRR
ncbi:protein ninH [Escherichia coli]|nr:protein ninH [Escherichia coli]RBU94457.1 protein ninH [Escherichia coli]